MTNGTSDMASRMTAAEFVTAIDREQGDLHKLFRYTVVDPETVPEEIESLAQRANYLMAKLDDVFERIANACGYDEDEEG